MNQPNGILDMTMQLSQVRYDECNWSMRYVLCQDVIIYQAMGTNVRQTQTPGHVNRTDR